MSLNVVKAYPVSLRDRWDERLLPTRVRAYCLRLPRILPRPAPRIRQ